MVLLKPACSKWLQPLLGSPRALRAAFVAAAQCCREPSSHLLSLGAR